MHCDNVHGYIVVQFIEQRFQLLVEQFVVIERKLIQQRVRQLVEFVIIKLVFEFLLLKFVEQRYFRVIWLRQFQLLIRRQRLLQRPGNGSAGD